MTASSPRAWTVQYSIVPINENAIRREAGPPVDSALPDPTKSPVPVASSAHSLRTGTRPLNAPHRLTRQSLSFVNVYPSISWREASLPCAVQQLRRRRLCHLPRARLAL